MIDPTTTTPDSIDARYQSHGFGRQALELLTEHVRTRPRASELLTSVVQAPGGGRSPSMRRWGFA